MKDTLDNRRIDAGSLSPRVQSKLKGQWNGLNIWVHNATYKDINGQTRYYLEPDCALLLARDAESAMYKKEGEALVDCDDVLWQCDALQQQAYLVIEDGKYTPKYLNGNS